MQQKIALARALLTSPVLMLLDEPTTGLDPRSKKDVQAFIRKIRDAHDSSILLCTHDMGEAEELCDRVGIMVDGRILALEEAEDLKRRYAGEANGLVPTMEETFMAATGYSVEEASAEEE
jgi:ABC-2 type transport system ATP-binding protein